MTKQARQHGSAAAGSLVFEAPGTSSSSISSTSSCDDNPTAPSPSEPAAACGFVDYEPICAPNCTPAAANGSVDYGPTIGSAATGDSINYGSATVSPITAIANSAVDAFDYERRAAASRGAA